MSFLDAAVFVFGTSFVMMVFVAKTDLEKSRVRAKAKK